MARELNPSIVKHVVREWLSSKDAVISMVVNELAARLAPIAARESAELLAAAIDTSVKERRIEELEDALCLALGAFDYVFDNCDSPTIELIIAEVHPRLTRKIMQVLPDFSDVRAELALEELGLAPFKAEEGGAA